LSQQGFISARPPWRKGDLRGIDSRQTGRFKQTTLSTFIEQLSNFFELYQTLKLFQFIELSNVLGREYD